MISTLSITNSTSIIQDFNTFLDYCEKENPKLTPTNSFLNRKSLHDLNQQLEVPATEVTSKSDQPYYHALHFYQQLAFAAELFKLDFSKKNPRLIVKEESLKSFRELKPLGQYLFLLKTYWMYCDWKGMLGPKASYPHLGTADPLLVDMSNSIVGKEYSRDKGDKIMDRVNWFSGDHIYFWEILGWLKATKLTEIGTKSTHYFSSISITSLGKAMAQFLANNRPFHEWNVFPDQGFGMPGFDSMYDMMEALTGKHEDSNTEHIEETPLPQNVLKLPAISNNPSSEEIQQQISNMEKEVKENLGVDIDINEFFEEFIQNGTEPSLMDITDHIAKKIADTQGMEDFEEESFEYAFSALFEKENIPALNILSPPELTEGQYLFKVSIAHDKEIWRTVLLDAGHTLAHLHMAIQNAFEFDNDHLYCFYMDNKIRGSKKAINDPRGGNPPFATNVFIGELDLSLKQRFLYLFDFGDNWEFHIDFLDFSTDKEKDLNFPKIVDMKGDAPDQYGNGFDEEYEEEEEW